MGTFSIWHWLVVLVIVVLVFGTKKLRNLGGDLGSAIKGFKDGMKDASTDSNATQPPEPATWHLRKKSKTPQQRLMPSKKAFNHRKQRLPLHQQPANKQPLP